MFDRIVLVTKLTRLQELRRRMTDDLIAFDLERKGSSIEEYRAEDDACTRAVRLVRQQLPSGVPTADVSRDDIAVSDTVFRPKDLIIAIGPDGLFANLAKYTNGQPILTVNPDPDRIAGVLMRFAPNEVGRAIKALQADALTIEEVTLARAQTNDGQVLYAVNDFFVGRLSHASAYYTVRYGHRQERQSSSGVIISTGCGSTGWMSSVAAGARIIAGGSITESIPFDRSARHLLFAVREPFPALGTSLVFGRIEGQKALTLTSELSEEGVIFSDGVIEHALQWNAGVRVEITVADKTARLVKPKTDP